MYKYFIPLYFLFSPLSAAEGVVESTHLDLKMIFNGSPLIYIALLVLSFLSFAIWLYTLLTVKLSKIMPEEATKQLKNQLLEKKYDAAFVSCQSHPFALSSIVASGISARKYGYQVMREAMQAEGKRCGVTLWQRIAILNDIATVAPMLGLLGTVVGLFLAFYDVNKTPDTLISIFDGLGIAVGTTVAGLFVAILAMIFYTMLKFRMIKLLNRLENEVHNISHLIED